MSILNKKYMIPVFILLVFISSALLVFTTYKTGGYQISQADFQKYAIGLFVQPTLYNLGLGVAAFIVNIYIFRLFNYDVIDLPAFYNLVISRGIATTIASIFLVLLGLKNGVIFNLLTLCNPLLLLVYYVFYKYFLTKGYQSKQLIRYLGAIFIANVIISLIPLTL